MHVLCPSCAAEYEIPELQRPRKLRCARCAAEWRVAPPPMDDPAIIIDIDGALPAASEDPPSGPRADPTPPSDRPFGSLLAGSTTMAVPVVTTKPPASRLVWTVLWVLSVLFIAAGLFVLWHWRLPIAHAWPPALRLLPTGMRSAASPR